MTDTALRRVEVNGVDFAYLTVGTGPLALCLHGFPDSAHIWRHLARRLADAGFRVVAPFTRGYAPTAVPADGRYQIGVLALDALGFHDAFDGRDDAVVIGHDWGAAAAWTVAAHAPDRWRAVVGLAVPPGPALAVALTNDLAQIKRSWYMFFFQHPLADVVVGADDLAFVDMLWADWSPGFFDPEAVADARSCLRDPAHLAAALGYYRAALGGGDVDPALAEMQTAAGRLPPQPALYLHGSTDGGVGIDVAELARRDAPEQLRVEIIDGVGHFLHLEQPPLVNDRIIDFLTPT